MSRKILSKRYKTEQLEVNKRIKMGERRESETDVLVTSVTRPRRSEDDIEVLGSVSSPAVVDLTVDLTSPLGRTTPPLNRTTPPLNEIVDLTDPSNESSSVVFLDSVPSRRTRRQRNNNHVMQPSQRDNILYIDHSDDSDGEVEVLPPTSPYNTRSAPHRTPPSSSLSNHSATGSTPKRVIVCPICMEDEPTIRAAGQQLTSTTCGHVFCNQCIRGAIATQHKCPTCRKRLTIRQIHPIFL